MHPFKELKFQNGIGIITDNSKAKLGAIMKDRGLAVLEVGIAAPLKGWHEFQSLQSKCIRKKILETYQALYAI
ncbi:hypothetical protein B1219_00825 [Pseudomonas ogarae]|nr:hypothetical protein B1219_00825 [Pseudomonas ogarae]OPG78459.1 hypothetical protein B1218_15455 [Pseudomonas ogarae]